MKSHPVGTLEPNSYFDAPVYLHKDYILLTPDTPVSEALVRRLRYWNYSQVYTEGKPVEKPAYKAADAESVNIAGTALDMQAQQHESSRLYFNLISFTEEVFKGFQSTNTLNIGLVTQNIKDLIELMKKNRDLILTFLSLGHPVENYLITHSVNTTVLSLAIGDFVKLPPHRLIELGISALLHDIGMLKLPPAVYNNAQPLSEQAKKAISAHPMIGYRMIKAFSVSENVALGVLEHQERVDGSGYPRHLKGDAISLYARIIAVADSYDSYISSRPYKQGQIMDGHHGILDLLKTNRQSYDERILKALVYCLSLYPLGTHVMLNNNAIGIVYQTNSKSPRYPIVKLVKDENGNTVREQILVQTSAEKKMEIIRILSPEDIKAL